MGRDDDRLSLYGLASMAIPIFITRVQFVFVKMTDAALTGHVAAFFLRVTAFSDFWTQLVTPFTGSQVLSQLAAPAVGAGEYAMVGIYLQASLVYLGFVSIPVIAWMLATQFALEHFVPENVAVPAGYYSTVLALTIPVRIFMGQLSQFLVAQNMADIPAKTLWVAPVLNLVFGLQFVLGIPAAQYAFGFYACPWVTVVVEYIGCSILFGTLVVIGRMRREPGQAVSDVWKCWPTKSILDIDHLRNTVFPQIPILLKLHMPQAVGLCSDFWRMSIVGWMSSWPAIAGAGIFNAGYRIAWLNLTATGALGTSFSVSIGKALGRRDAKEAERLFWMAIKIALAMQFLVTALMMVFVNEIAGIFTSDPQFAVDFTAVRIPFAFFLFSMNFTVVLEGVLYALKRNAEVMRAGLVGSWVGQVLSTFILLQFVSMNLASIYWGVTIGYCLCMGMFYLPLSSVDWNLEAERAASLMG